MGMQNVNGKWVYVITFEEKVNAAASRLSNDIDAARRELKINNTPKAIYKQIADALKPESKPEIKKGLTAAQLAKMGVKSFSPRPLTREEKEDMGLGAQTGYGWVDFS